MSSNDALGLGRFAESVLLVVHHLQGRGYAVSISKDLRDRSGSTANLGAIYAALDRLEDKKLISSKLGDPTPERGGRPKRLYQIEAPGIRALAAARVRDQGLWTGLPPLGVPA